MNRSSFLMKVSFVLFALACASTVAGFCAWKYWHVIWTAAGYDATDFVNLNAERQALKTPLNLMMYAMPGGFWCAGAGLFVVSGLFVLLDMVGDVSVFFSGRFTRMRTKDNHHA